MVWKLVYFRYYVIVIQFCGHVTTNDYGVLSNMATISEGTSEGGKEMFEIGEALEAENEKPELDVLVDVINEHLDYFNEDKDFEKEVEDAVQEIEIPPKHPCPSCNKICKSKGGLTRHIRSKHTLLEANDGKDDNSTATISKAIVEDLFKKANSKIGTQRVHVVSLVLALNLPHIIWKKLRISRKVCS